MKVHTEQYTIRGIPSSLDRILKARAKKSSKSFNQVALEALAAGAQMTLTPVRDFSEVIGSLSEKEAKHMNSEIEHQRQIDLALWK